LVAPPLQFFIIIIQDKYSVVNINNPRLASIPTGVKEGVRRKLFYDSNDGSLSLSMVIFYSAKLK
jgi:hypothetical protein